MDELADKIAAKVYELYDSFSKSGKPIETQEWTLLAGFLMDKDDSLEVISIATGTKCIGSKEMCPNGLIINDSHAEVLARRSFLRYLYSEIFKVKQKHESQIFSGLCTSDGKHILRDGIKFYFFTSHVPCGDASIIPITEDGRLKKGLKRKFKEIEGDNYNEENPLRDIHRTGAKPVESELRQDPRGEGENYHTSGAVRIKPGRGDPTLSLSCSDKIARWISIGVQGALLSQLIENPIKIDIIVIGGGSQYEQNVIENALIRRSGTANQPIIIQSTLVFKHSAINSTASRPCPASIMWANITDEKPQISVNGKRLGATKKTKGNFYLPVCKRELFKSFLNVSGNEGLLNETYREVKNKSMEYQNQFNIFKKAMGAWSADKTNTQNFKISKEELLPKEGL